MKPGSEQFRVRAALRNRGRHGITQVDFLGPNVIDGDKPITRVAARINDLKNDGYVIVDNGWRNKCKVYVLVREPVAEPLAGEPAPMSLFDPPVQPTNAIYGDAA